MSRLNGTYCYCETDVFTKDTSAYNTWTYYGEQANDNIIAYAIKITGFENEDYNFYLEIASNAGGIPAFSLEFCIVLLTEFNKLANNAIDPVH